MNCKECIHYKKCIYYDLRKALEDIGKADKIHPRECAFFKLTFQSATQEYKQKIYIAGKITGDENYHEKFNKAEEKYKEKGYIVLNPAWMPQGMKTEDYMRICLAMIDTADIVVFLDDYENSKGAKLEFDYCVYTKKEVLFDA